MKKIMAGLLVTLALAACAEVTTFRRPDGSTFYYVSCGDSMKLESCRSAAERTCPKGFTAVTGYAQGTADAVYGACVQANEQRRLNREPPLQCQAPRRNDSFFACK